MIYIGIPARLASTRMPNKPMTIIHGIPMLQHVIRRCEIAAALIKAKTEVFVATPDDEIINWCKDKEFNVYRTPQDIPRPCLRVMDAVKYKMTEDDLLIVVQGDEPCVVPADIVKFYKKWKKYRFDFEPYISNGYTNSTEKESNDVNELSVVVSKSEKALYFSRNSIPNITFAVVEPNFYKQVCIFGYNIWACEMMMHGDCGQLENTEYMEMMRPLENDIPIHMIKCDARTHSVDVVEDIPIVEDLICKFPIFVDGTII